MRYLKFRHPHTINLRKYKQINNNLILKPNFTIYGDKKNPHKCFFNTEEIFNEFIFKIPFKCNNGFTSHNVNLNIDDKPKDKNLHINLFNLNNLISSLESQIILLKEWLIKEDFKINIDDNDDKIKHILKSSVMAISCVYFFKLNTVNKLKNIMNIDQSVNDNYIVCKYGKTNDLFRRYNEHKLSFGKIENVKLELLYYSNIEPENITQAESLIKQYLQINCTKLKYNNYDELFIINPNKLKNIETQFKMLGNTFYLNSNELKNKMKIMKMEYDYKLKLQKKENIINKLKYKNLENQSKKK